MLDIEQIRRLAQEALISLDHIQWLASQVALKNLQTYGYLSPENVAAIEKHG